MCRGVWIGMGGIEFGGLEALGALAEGRQFPFCYLVSKTFGGYVEGSVHVKTLEEFQSLP